MSHQNHYLRIPCVCITWNQMVILRGVIANWFDKKSFVWRLGKGSRANTCSSTLSCSGEALFLLSADLSAGSDRSITSFSPPEGIPCFSSLTADDNAQEAISPNAIRCLSSWSLSPIWYLLFIPSSHIIESRSLFSSFSLVFGNRAAAS